MKKHLLLAAGLALGMGVNAQVTLHQENFDSGNPFTGGGATTDYALNCGATANTYCIVTDLGAKYGGANGQTDHTSGSGSMAAYDGFTSGTNRDAYDVQITSTGGPVTLDFWGHNRFGSHQGNNNVNVNLQIMVDGSTVATEVIGAAAGWQNFNVPLGVLTAGPHDITIRQQHTGAYEDYGLDDILITEDIPASMSATSLFMDGFSLVNQHIEKSVTGDGYVIAGSAVTNTTSSIFLFEIDRSGNVLWNNVINIGTNTDTKCYGFTRDAQTGTYLATGYTNTSATKREAYVMRIDGGGNPIQTAIINPLVNTDHSIALDIILLKSQEILIGGFTDQATFANLGTNGDPTNGFVTKLTPNFGIIWNAKINANATQLCSGNDNNSMVSRLIETPNGYYVAGTVTDGNSTNWVGQAALSVMLSPGGSLLWDNSYNIVDKCKVPTDVVPVDVLLSGGKVYSSVQSGNWHNTAMDVINPATGITNQYYYALQPGYDKGGISLEGSLSGSKNGVQMGIDLAGQPYLREFDLATGNVYWEYQYDVLMSYSYFQNFGNSDPRLVNFGKPYGQSYIENGNALYVEKLPSTKAPNGSYIMVASRCPYPGSVIGLDIIEIDDQGHKVDASKCGYNPMNPDDSESYQSKSKGATNTLNLPSSAVANAGGSSEHIVPIACSGNTPALKTAMATSVAENAVTSALTVAPNPASGQVQFSGIPTVATQLQIIDLSGRVVYTQSMNGQTQVTINVSDLARAMYQVLLRNDQDEVISRSKLVKQ